MKILSRFLAFSLCICIPIVSSACSQPDYGPSGQIIIDAQSLSDYIGKDGVVIVDMQSEENYAGAHVQGAVNIQVSSVLINLPVDNMLAPRAKIASVLGEAGIDNHTQIIIYDDGDCMKASRLWWSILVYGYDNVRVINGGIDAIRAAGIPLTADNTVVTARKFTTEDRREQYVADMRAVLSQVDNPQKNVILLDTRSDREYLESGKIPGAVMYDYIKNYYSDGTLMNIQATRINYIQQDIRAENKIILYCQTSMRAAVTFLCLYDAGYRHLKMYDGSYLEWSASGSNPVDMQNGAAPAGPRDSS